MADLVAKLAIFKTGHQLKGLQMQDKDQELQQAEGGKGQLSEHMEEASGARQNSGLEPSEDHFSALGEQPTSDGGAPSDSGKEEGKTVPVDPGKPLDEIEDQPSPEESPTREPAPGAPRTSENEPEPSKAEDPIDEIDESNAEDAEDTDNEKRHHIPFLDYHGMPLENLVGELQRLVRNEKVQAIGKHVSAIKYEFDQKFQEFLEQKKEDFVSRGGNEIDFKYNSVDKRQFNEVYADYREKRDQYYKQLEQNLKSNLQNRLEIIEDLKGLIDVEEDINTTYNNFKDLQQRWRNAGPIPRNHYNDVWRTYHHHMEIFYDFLHLNRELRDLDFK